MGYHLVDVLLRDGRLFANVPVYNASLMDLPAGAGRVRQDDIAELSPHLAGD